MQPVPNFFSPAAHKIQLERVSSETDSRSNCDKVKMEHLSEASSVGVGLF